MIIQSLKKEGLPLDRFRKDYVTSAIDTTYGKLGSTSGSAGYAGFYFQDPKDVEWDAEACAQHLTPENHAPISALRDGKKYRATR